MNVCLVYLFLNFGQILHIALVFPLFNLNR